MKKSHKPPDSAYARLKNELLEAIDTNFKPGDRFFTQRKIMKDYGIGYSTVEKALGQLVDEGVLVRRQGSGTFVSKVSVPEVTTLAVFVHHADNLFFSEIVKSAEETARQQGFHLIVCNTLDDTALEQQYFHDLMKERKVSGLLICPVDKHLGTDIYSAIRSTGFPCVLFPTVDMNAALRMDYVVTDEVEGAYLATRHLLEKGCRRIAFVSVDTERDVCTANRMSGYRRALAEFDVTPDADLWIKGGDLEKQGGEEAGEKLLAMDELPDGIFAMSDLMAIGIMSRFREKGVKIGEDMRVVGFDDIEMAAWPEFSLTTIRQSRAEIGRLAVDTLLARVQGRTPEAPQCVLVPELVVRGSS